MAKTIAGGVKITVDTQDLFKFTRTAEQLNATLTKSQKALRLVYNEQGLLTNALGKCVEGLSQSQIKLGLWVDELGRVRTLNDEFATGLSKSRLEMGFFADELGNVYNAAGDLVEELGAAKNALDDVAQKGGDAQGEVDALGGVFDSLSDVLGGGFRDAFEKAKKIAELGEKFQEFANKGGSLGDGVEEAARRRLSPPSRSKSESSSTTASKLASCASVGTAFGWRFTASKARRSIGSRSPSRSAITKARSTSRSSDSKKSRAKKAASPARMF